MNNITKWTLGGLGALVIAIGLALYMWRRDKKPALGECKEVERNTYKLIAYSIETCTGDSGTDYYFGKVEQLNTPVERSLGWPSRDQAFGWIKLTIDQRQAGANRQVPLLGAVPAGQAPKQATIDPNRLNQFKPS